MDSKKDFWFYLNLLEVGKWYDLHALHTRLLQLETGCNNDFTKFVAFIIVTGDAYYIDTDKMQIKRLQLYGK